MANLHTNTKDIKYLNKDYTTFKEALVEYARAYFPSSYNDFSSASPGTMFIEMASYVGDVMSFYLDNQIQETFLQYAKQKENLYTLAYMLGYRPKVTSASAVNLEIFQTIPASGSTGNKVPDFRYALMLDEGMQVASSINANVNFYLPEKVDFSVSSSNDITEISVYSVAGDDPASYLLKKTTPAISGLIKQASLTFGTPVKFSTSTVADTNIIEIIDVYDADGNRWYEVPYLAQDTIMLDAQNNIAASPDFGSQKVHVPYLLELLKVPRRFTTRFKGDGTLEIQFGSGINTEADENLLPDTYNVGLGTVDSVSKMGVAYDPTNFTTTETYGLAPSNTTLTVRYLVGGGATSNVPSNELNTIVSYGYSFYGGQVDGTLGASTLQSLAVNNPTAAVGGGDGDTIEQIRLNTLHQFPSQMRAVTQQDYLAMINSMPGKFGQVAKAYITNDTQTYKGQTTSSETYQDPLATTAYILAYDADKRLMVPPTALMHNLKAYVSQYRMLTDSITLKSAYIINIGVNFDITIRPDYASREVLANCLSTLIAYFDIDKWQINQPILLSEIYTNIDRVPGVQTVRKVTIVNKAGINQGYSAYGYDIAGGTLNNVIYPSLDPSIFEVKYPNTDIVGRVVTF
jgi:hypothetical protein